MRALQPQYRMDLHRDLLHDPRWQREFLPGEVGYTELAAHPEALDQLRLDPRMDGWHNASQLESFLTHLGQEASTMLFRCALTARQP
ncbi:hypothetical protein ACFV8Z_27345 [Streptomyces sp. NPDC059837]|uniref:hypothetical protein n=1 Tax=Streptomyces sp. NPDC059837 TaxID=3346968 RepID=UPI00366496C2